MSKYIISKKGKDEFAFLTPELKEKINLVYNLGITGVCVGIARNKILYAIIYKHKCRKYTAFTLSPLTYETMSHLLDMLRQAKGVIELLNGLKKKDVKNG